ncbi:exocyst complex component Sec10-like protein [Gilbertella persicaria]|uniref:exocyst complex component Sec10-like protein n=1 Tax=Gilbertella persicaria TaxID=101096 RepID=UPI002221155E|nr:exocyst complex component Sec10-like protein [Gilbertella persicaria]KAI8086885.1 exocyst complex component Sec10-like protein [Gilbertella persicaria]
MSLIDDDTTFIDSTQPIQPVQVSLSDAAKSRSGRLIPPDVLLRIFKYLPVASLTKIALVSRRFKVLAYDDEIWDEKLNIMLKNDTGALAAMLDGESTKGSLIDSENTIYINSKPLNTLIPGMSTDPYQARARAKSTGLSREYFKQLYTQLMPYYIDLRDGNKESTKVLHDFGGNPEECGKVINLLVGLGQCHVVDDWEKINEGVNALSQYFESASLHEFEVAYDAHNTEEMKSYASALIALNGGSTCMQTYVQKHPIFYDNPFKPEDNFAISNDDLTPFKKFMMLVADELSQQSSIVLQVFPEKMDAFYMFVDRVFEDVIAEFVSQLLGIAMQTNAHLYLRTMSAVLTATEKVIKVLTSEDLPKPIERDRGVNLLFKLFLPFLDDYLYEEAQYAEKITKKYIEEWSNRSAFNTDISARLTNQSRETFKRNYLTAFKKVLTLPVDLVSTAATTIASPFQRASIISGASKSSGDKRSSITSVESISTSQTTPPSTPKATSMNRISSSSTISTEQPRSSFSRDVTGQLEFARQELDMLQNYLSLETSLQIIHINKESEGRVQQFIDIGFPGRMKSDIQRTYEQIFIQLLKTLGSTHIQPGFKSASDRLSSFKPSLDQMNEDVPPLTAFFELVHVADVIQQMIQLYYDEEITKNVDKHDFMNEVNKEKKSFERLLDDCVAQGMDRGIQVLLSQVEFILVNEQKKEDYNPPAGSMPDLKPTKACQDTINCLKTNTSMLVGAAEKGTMDLFFSEIGRRFFEILCKHLKMQTVNEMGGFRYISDMNAYYDFILTLRQKTITPYFLALKSLANLYIIESATDIKSLIHDLERYHGLMRVEDLFEFAACRSDWPAIKRVVQKDMTDCCIM